MSVKVRAHANTQNTGTFHGPEWLDSTIEQRTAITPDGYAVHFAPNEIKNFADDGIGAAVAAFKTDAIEEDTRTGSSRA